VDVYALGIVFYELLTGQRPFNADTDVALMHSILFEQPPPAAQLRPELPEPVLRILERATAKDREQRYPDCIAFQADLEEYILSTGKPVTTQLIAQLIAQVSPPQHDAPLPPLPPGSAPLTDTEIRSAPDTDSFPPDHPLLVETAPRPQADSLPSMEALSVPARSIGRLRAALAAGMVLIASGGGFLLWGRTGPAQPALTATTPAVPSPPAAPTEPAAPPSGTPPAEATPRQDPGEVRANHDAKTGTLEFEVRPSAVVYLEGKRLGTAPPLGVLDINPGTYRVKFVNKKLGKTVERPVEVKAGQTTFIQVDLLHKEEAQTP
jgi:serine/threonine-protein kinase